MIKFLISHVRFITDKVTFFLQKRICQLHENRELSDGASGHNGKRTFFLA